MSRRVAVIIMALLTLLLGVVAVFIGLRLQQPDDSFVSGNFGEACLDNPSGICLPTCGSGRLLSGSCNGGLRCCSPTSTTTSSGTATTSRTTTATVSTPSQCRQNQDTCGGSNGSCCSGLVCQGTQGNQRCQPQNNCSPDNPQFCQCNTDGAVCGGGAGGFISFVCSQLDAQGECHQNPVDNHATFQDALNRVNNAGGCGQVDTVWIGGPCNRQLCGGFTIIDTGCNNNTTSGTTGTSSGTTGTSSTTTGGTRTSTTGTVTTSTGTTSTATASTTISTSTAITTTASQSTTASQTTAPQSTTSGGGVGGTSSSGTGGTLPKTALISDDVDRVLIAAVILVLGYLMLRFEIVDNLFLQAGEKLGVRRSRKLVVRGDKDEQ